MKKYIFTILFLFYSFTIFSDDAKTIIQKVEKNLSVKNVIYKARMVVEENENKRSMDMIIYVKNEKNVYVEVLSSTDGNRSRFLKKDNSMWLFLPTAGRSVLIKGHMLKEGFMGSAFSYEDLSERRNLTDMYSIDLSEDDNSYILLMKAKVDDAPYKLKKSYIRKDVYLPYKEEIYSSSGRLLKEFFIKDYEKIKNIYFPKKIIMKDLLQSNNVTTIEYTQINLKDNLSDSYFTKTYLER